MNDGRHFQESTEREAEELHTGLAEEMQAQFAMIFCAPPGEQRTYAAARLAEWALRDSIDDVASADLVDLIATSTTPSATMSACADIAASPKIYAAASRGEGRLGDSGPVATAERWRDSADQMLGAPPAGGCR